MMMDDEKNGLGSSVVAFEEKNESLSAMLFGASCAFLALRIIMNPEIDDDKWLIVKDRLHQGCTHLLGLLVWRVQRERLNLEDAEREIEELKRRRREDGKANEKVMGIISTREQGWLSERKKLRRKIGDFLHELQVVHKKNGEAISELQSKDELLKAEEQKRIELEVKLKATEAIVEELREASNRRDQGHCREIWKHKKAFFEVVSNQRQLQAEMGRALRQAKASKQELDSVSRQKEESNLLVQKLSMELRKIRKDLEQKDNILSAMLRKSKLDTTEKQILLNEVKLSKSKPKQAEPETELFSPVCFPVFAADIKQLEGWVCSQAKKYINVVERQHQLEIDAFAEQMRLKEEKLESCRWRLLSMDLESKRLHANIEGLVYDISQLRQDNMKLEASLLDRESTLRSFKKQLGLCLEFPNTKDVATTTVQSTENVDPVCFKESQVKPENSSSSSSSSSSSLSKTYSTKDGGISSSWKMDLHALGVSYKIKRLKHQIHMLQMLTGKQLECPGMLELHTLISLLNKQVHRYESLQTKVDDLCKRMNEKNVYSRNGEWSIGRTKEETKSLEQFLEETLQLQRYIVSAGQRLIEIQSKMTSEFVVGTWEFDNGTAASGFDAKRFAENVRTLFREVQRGLEVRISQVIGDVEGTLARDGMMQLT